MRHAGNTELLTYKVEHKGLFHPYYEYVCSRLFHLHGCGTGAARQGKARHSIALQSHLGDVSQLFTTMLLLRTRDAGRRDVVREDATRPCVHMTGKRNRIIQQSANNIHNAQMMIYAFSHSFSSFAIDCVVRN